MHRGYLALWRKFKDHSFWRERRVFSKAEAWIDIITEAQHDDAPREICLGMTVLTQHYGECLKSNRTWSQRWGWSESKVRRFLKLLKKLEMISLKNEVKTTRITLCNYSQYDPKQHRHDADTTQTRRTSGDKQECKEGKNEKKKKDISVGTPHHQVAENLKTVVLLRRKREVKPSDLTSWANTIRLMDERDKVSLEAISAVIEWYKVHWNDSKFIPVIESAGSLREKWGKLLSAMERENKSKQPEGKHNGFDQRNYQQDATSYEDLPDFLR